MTPYGPKGPRFKDLQGLIFDKLTVMLYLGYDENRKLTYWECRCECGKVVQRTTDILTRKRSNHSCGCVGTRPVLPNNQHAFNRMFLMYKNNAKKRNYDFKLTKQEFRNIIILDCYYCGQEPESRYENSTIDAILANGVDRVNNQIGYNIYNCVPCCKICNRAKGDLTVEEFKNWIKNVNQRII